MRFLTRKDDPEAPVLDLHPYFRARIRHLVETNPLGLIGMYEQKTLLEHLRLVTNRAILEEIRLKEMGLTREEARERVIAQVVADDQPPAENDRAIDQAAHVARRFERSLQSEENPAILMTPEEIIELNPTMS